MNRFYAIETTPTSTGGNADHRLPLKPSEVEGFVRAIAQGVGVSGAGAGDAGPHAAWVNAIVKDLQAHRGACVVVPGEYQSPVVHALAHAINAALDTPGNTVIYTDPLETQPMDQMAALKELVGEMNAGKVDTLLILSANPVYTAPADLEFAKAMDKVNLRAHVGLYANETARLCHWHVPEAHYLEAWGDARAFDGTITILQPLIAPLYENRSLHEVFSVLNGQADRSSHDNVKAYWRGQFRGTDEEFEDQWHTWLHNGVVPNTALPARTVAVRGNFASTMSAAPSGGGLEIVFRPDPGVYDGRFSNNGWLQEWPRPLTRLTWDNAALISPATAQRLQLDKDDVVELTYQGRKVRVPIWILPGQPADTVTVSFGYGRTASGRLSNGIGYNAYALRTSDQPWFGTGLQLQKTGAKYWLVSTQLQDTMEGRDLIRVATQEEYLRNPKAGMPAPEAGGEALTEGSERNQGIVDRRLSIYPDWKYEGYAWGMTIDLNRCVGCGACVVACYAENNIAIVGKQQVGMGRHMQWLRIDRYYSGALDNPRVYYEPILCMHCEDAPCEPVCPVAATVHSSEGLNQMVYNRCVGTRYCSNNCPYKVRRFNYLLYSDWSTQSLYGVRNPEVTVRSRGVMEKCTYCVQRIQNAKIEAEKENRGVRDGEIVTACQAACPTEAIVFGNINDRNSRVYKLKSEERNYGLLAELGTRPRTSYLTRLRNPNPDLEKA
jgi:Fe-S-cluster-containing dehydrogenase component